MGQVVENALRRLMLEEPNQVSVWLVAWVVTGHWPTQPPRYDVAFADGALDW